MVRDLRALEASLLLSACFSISFFLSFSHFRIRGHSGCGLYHGIRERVNSGPWRRLGNVEHARAVRSALLSPAPVEPFDVATSQPPRYYVTPGNVAGAEGEKADRQAGKQASAEPGKKWSGVERGWESPSARLANRSVPGLEKLTRVRESEKILYIDGGSEREIPTLDVLRFYCRRHHHHCCVTRAIATPLPLFLTRNYHHRLALGSGSLQVETGRLLFLLLLPTYFILLWRRCCCRCCSHYY